MLREELGEALERYYKIYGVTSVQSRSLPDFFSGLKPIQKRILLVLSEHYKVGKFTKSMSVCADTQKLYHPHGEISVYHTLVNLVQPFHTRLPVIRPQGNWGSSDGDSPAAPRYTECSPEVSISIYTEDLKHPCVPMVSNYSGELLEPSFLPAKLPMLMINGSQGIAVGFACSFLPHNPLEVYNFMVALLHQGDSIKVSNYLKGPDFPTGGTVINSLDEVKSILDDGKGSYKVRGDYWVENRSGMSYIHFTSTPYRYARSDITKRIKELMIARELPEVHSVYDNSGQNGIDLVIKVKGYAVQEALRKLFRMTDLRVSMSVNQFCLVGGKPEKLSLKQVAERFILERSRIVISRTQHLIVNTRKECNVLRTKVLAVMCLDEIIKLIRIDHDVESEISKLMVKEESVRSIVQDKEVLEYLLERKGFSQEDVDVILRMTIGQLRKVSVDKSLTEMREKLKFTHECRKILNDKSELFRVIEKDMHDEVSRLTPDLLQRRTTVQAEDLTKVQDSVLIVYSDGTLKRVVNEEIIDQNKGGIGKTTLQKTGADITLASYLTSNVVIIFTNLGYAYKETLTGFNWEEDSFTSVLELINLRHEEERVIALIEYKDNLDFVLMATNEMRVKKVKIREIFSKVNKRKVIKLRETEKLTDAQPCESDQEVLIMSDRGYGLRMDLTELKTSSLASGGVLGIRSKPGKCKLIVTPRFISVGETGFGSVQLLENYRLQRRGGAGTFLGHRKKDVLLSNLHREDYVLLVTNRHLLKISLDQLKESNRRRKGLKLINLKEDTLRFVCSL